MDKNLTFRVVLDFWKGVNFWILELEMEMILDFGQAIRRLIRNTGGFGKDMGGFGKNTGRLGKNTGRFSKNIRGFG